MKLSFRSVLVPIAAALVGVAFRALNVPAAWFFGPLAVSALVAICGWHETDVPRPIYLAAQAVIGTALGAGIGQAVAQLLALVWERLNQVNAAPLARESRRGCTIRPNRG